MTLINEYIVTCLSIAQSPVIISILIFLLPFYSNQKVLSNLLTTLLVFSGELLKLIWLWFLGLRAW